MERICRLRRLAPSIDFEDNMRQMAFCGVGEADSILFNPVHPVKKMSLYGQEKMCTYHRF